MSQTSAMPEERRVVTVLFADVMGSTALGEELDPEDMRALLALYYATAKDVVAQHGGTVEKFIGDAVMAVFGLQQAHGDDPERALSAALELRDRVRSDAKLGERFPIRIGVNTGEVVAAREHDAGDFLVTGDVVNVAARLQQAAAPWSVMCGERTARAARATFAFADRISLDAKGKRQPVSAYALNGRLDRPSALRVPLLGRDADLEQLELVARRAFAEQRPFLVSVIAPAGTGKTRLLEEFLDRLPRTHENAQVAIAQCLPYGQRLTYWPLRAVLYRLVGLTEDALPTQVREQIAAWLARNDFAGHGATANLLAATVGAGEGEVTDRAALFSAWRDAIELASTRGPLVLVFEDLHWSADSLLDLVEYVMQPRADAPVLMIALTRPELLDRRPNWGGGRRNHLALTLEPLAESAVTRLVEHLLESARPDVVQRIVKRSEGNPFYAGELVRSLIERTSSLTDVRAVEEALANLPDTVQATVLARLDLLDASSRRVLQVGAVFGRTFRVRGVAEVDGLDDASVALLCQDLIIKDLVRHVGSDDYTFRHILIREVAYQTLTRGERARLHAAAGRWLEAQATGREEALAELIAYHYREAVGLTSAAGGGEVAPLRASAVRWLETASQAATAGAASLEAARHLRAAIELTDDDQRRAVLFEKLGDLSISGDQSSAAYQSSIQLYRQIGAPAEQLLSALAGLLTIYTRSMGSIANRPSQDELDRLRMEAAALVERVGDERIVARFFIAESFLPFWLGSVTKPDVSQFDAAETAATRALSIAERLDDARLQSAARDGLAAVQTLRGQARAALKTNYPRLALEDRVDLLERMDAYGVITWAHCWLGELDDAARVSAAGLALLQPGQVPAWALHVVAWRAYALALRGDWDQAAAAGERALMLWEESGRLTAGYALRGFAAAFGVAHARGAEAAAERYREAIEEIERAFIARQGPRQERYLAFVRDDAHAMHAAIAERFPYDHRVIELWERLYARLADLAYAVDADLAQRVIAFAVRYEYRALEASARRAFGVGADDQAELRRALEIFDAIGAVPYSARTRCELAQRTGDRMMFDAGARVLDGLGDVDQLRRYEDLFGR